MPDVGAMNAVLSAPTFKSSSTMVQLQVHESQRLLHALDMGAVESRRNSRSHRKGRTEAMPRRCRGTRVQKTAGVARYCNRIEQQGIIDVTEYSLSRLTPIDTMEWVFLGQLP